jgi:pyruvate dehydrogenase E2 component (dihydrolipoamide acetyltransferase)
MRRTIAKRLGASYREAVHVTLNREIEVDAVIDAAEALDGGIETDISITDVLLVALSATLSDHPEFNATFEDETHQLYEEQHVGIAVDIEEGLVAPILRDVGGHSLADLSEQRTELTQRTLEGDYTMDDLSGGTFTVSNLGVLGVDSFDPVINRPQVAILGIGRIRERPTVVDDEVEVRSWMNFSLSFDHRVVDGADAARFLETFASYLEDPWPLLVERL